MAIGPAQGAAAHAPALWQVLRAEPDWHCIDLLSDVHLHADMPLTFRAWRQHLLHTPAQAVLILGDLFEVWVGDEAAAIGLEAQALATLRAAAAQRWVGFMPGNRDFLMSDAVLAACGMHRLHDPTLLQACGQSWLLSHGDALCVDDEPYQRFRAQVRDPAWQAAFLAQPLAERLAQARAMREASSAHQAARGPERWSDVDAPSASHWVQQAAAQGLVHGHTHRPGRHPLPGGGQRVVLGDWDLDQAPQRARILRLDSSGLHPLDLAAP